MSALSVENLTLSYGALCAIDSLSFEVADGERLVIFGPNGAGKTTLFNVITGLLAPSSGAVRLFGNDLAQLSTRKRVALGLGRTFQITTLFPRMTALESAMLAVQAGERWCFAMHRSIESFPKVRRRALELLDDWGIVGKADVQTQLLSYGEQRQLELVMALARGPRLLLLDEPAAGLSAAETATVESMIKRFSREITVLLIEHDVDMALRLADRVLVMQQGRLVVSGSPEEIRSDSRVAQIDFGEDLV